MTRFFIAGAAATVWFMPIALWAQEAHWAFQPVRPVAVPKQNPPGAQMPIDALHGAILQARGLEMADPAPRRVMARRLAFHLHGLPPAHEEVEAFERDGSPNAYERYVDRLLASPRYGERWARHWMDVARYADNKGYVFEEERRYSYAYTYRDWLVGAINEDLPYDDFIVQQLAGDFVAKESGNQMAQAAMGFLTLGRRFLNRQPDIIDDRIDVMTRGLLGLTVSCARCHDHKFDPIPIEDYYSLYGVFASSHEPEEKPLLGKPDLHSPAYRHFHEESAKLQAAMDEFFQVRHAKLRTAPILRAYLRLAHDGRDWDESLIGSRAQREKLYQKIAIRWRDWIARHCREEHPAFVPWKAFAQGADHSVLDEIKERSHPILWRALHQAGADSMDDLIEVYAREIAAANQVEQHDDPKRESLRQLLVAKDSPTGLEPEQLYRIFNTPGQQAVRRMRRELERHAALSPGARPRGMVLQPLTVSPGDGPSALTGGTAPGDGSPGPGQARGTARLPAGQRWCTGEASATAIPGGSRGP